MNILTGILDTFCDIIIYGTIVLSFFGAIVMIVFGVFYLNRVIGDKIRAYLDNRERNPWIRHCEDVKKYHKDLNQYREIQKKLQKYLKIYNKKGTLNKGQYKKFQKLIIGLLNNDLDVLEVTTTNLSNYFTNPSDFDYKTKLDYLMTVVYSLPNIKFYPDEYYDTELEFVDDRIPTNSMDIFTPEHYGADDPAQHPDSKYLTFESIEKRCELKKNIILGIYYLIYGVLAGILFVAILRKVYDYAYYRTITEMLKQYKISYEIVLLNFLWR